MDTPPRVIVEEGVMIRVSSREGGGLRLHEIEGANPHWQEARSNLTIVDKEIQLSPSSSHR